MTSTPRDPRVLSEAAEFVRDVATTIAPQTEYSISRSTTIIGRYCDWATRTRALPLVPGLIFDAQTIDLYVRDARATGRLAASSVAAYRSVLLRASEVYLPSDLKSRPQGIGAIKTREPYSADELSRFPNWMRGQRTPLLREKATTLACLGLGCGLRAGEINALRRANVDIDGSDVTVTVIGGNSSREVPMLSRWAAPFIHAIADREPDDFVWGNPRRTRVNPNALAEFVVSANGLLKPSTYRMRTTWIVGALVAGVPLRLLLETAGLERLEKLTDYVGYLPPIDEDDLALLRKAGMR